MDLAKIYPYVVPEGYVENQPNLSDGFLPSLGHNVYAMLVHSLENVCGSVTRDELAGAGLSFVEIHQRALNNLEELAHGPEIQKAVYQGPGGNPFVLWSGHWLTASCIRLPGLHAFAKKFLGLEEVCVSIPQREAMLLFPMGTQDQRNQMRELIRENEQDARKLVTWELFQLSSEGIKPLTE